MCWRIIAFFVMKMNYITGINTRDACCKMSHCARLNALSWLTNKKSHRHSLVNNRKRGKVLAGNLDCLDLVAIIADGILIYGGGDFLQGLAMLSTGIFNCSFHCFENSNPTCNNYH